VTPTQNKVAFTTLANIAENQPLVRIAVKYWWLMIPAGFVMYLRVSKRTSKDIIGIMEDFGVSFGPVIPLIMLSESLAARQQAAAPVGAIKEAQFTVQPTALPISGIPQPFPTV
jgi:hypothetical protein